MNGLIFMEVKKFVIATLGDHAWHKVVHTAGVPSRLYVPVADYPDEELVALLTTLSSTMGKPTPAMVEDLGAFIAPDLLGMFAYLIHRDWKTIDLIANTEETIHEVLRRAGTKTNPPVLQSQRLSPQEVLVTYTSPRKLCALAKGIAQGVATHYGERITITELTCMLQGGSMCELLITVV